VLYTRKARERLAEGAVRVQARAGLGWERPMQTELRSRHLARPGQTRWESRATCRKSRWSRRRRIKGWTRLRQGAVWRRPT